VPVLGRGAFFGDGDHFGRTGQPRYFVAEDWLQAHGNVVGMVAMERHAFLALAMPFTEGIRACAPDDVGIGCQLPVL